MAELKNSRLQQKVDDLPAMPCQNATTLMDGKLSFNESFMGKSREVWKQIINSFTSFFYLLIQIQIIIDNLASSWAAIYWIEMWVGGHSHWKGRGAKLCNPILGGEKGASIRKRGEKLTNCFTFYELLHFRSLNPGSLNFFAKRETQWRRKTPTTVTESKTLRQGAVRTSTHVTHLHHRFHVLTKRTRPSVNLIKATITIPLSVLRF